MGFINYWPFIVDEGHRYHLKLHDLSLVNHCVGNTIVDSLNELQQVKGVFGRRVMCGSRGMSGDLVSSAFD